MAALEISARINYFMFVKATSGAHGDGLLVR